MGIQSSTHGEYPSRRVKTSNQTMSNSNKTLKEVGHSSIMAPPTQALKVNTQSPPWAGFITQGLPCNFGEAMVLVVLDPPMGPGHVGEVMGHGANLWSHRTPGFPANLGPGAHVCPRGLQ
ncbi:hypothetical protein O181_123826 [Austropuccinia psidii MF-1]|uniref:Uncharacterized protein n=1 Tax=Austropuccinia psidii MF-1 TaxID=1389203 RepID=A0A9Q3KPZ4_9BASI|nr:hypothetical protein [Austropuccinia psidii MF-1]